AVNGAVRRTTASRIQSQRMESPRAPRSPSAKPDRSNALRPANVPIPRPPPEEANDEAHEVQLRRIRQRRRAIANLIIFTVGTVVMVVFAMVVIKLSRPS